jgi:hypothetical protein
MEAFPTGLFRGPYFGKVTSSLLVDGEEPDLRKWNYTIELVQFDGQEWNDHDAPPELTDVRNVFEASNTSSVSMGITNLGLPGTYQLQPAPDGAIVPVWITPVGPFMMWPNQFDGAC